MDTKHWKKLAVRCNRKYAKIIPNVKTLVSRLALELIEIVVYQVEFNGCNSHMGIWIVKNGSFLDLFYRAHEGFLQSIMVPQQFVRSALFNLRVNNHNAKYLVQIVSYILV